MSGQASKNGSGVPRGFYRCSGRTRWGKDACSGPNFRQTDVDAFVLRYFEEIGIDREGTIAQIAAEMDTAAADTRAAREAAQTAVMGLRSNRARVERGYREGRRGIHRRQVAGARCQVWG